MVRRYICNAQMPKTEDRWHQIATEFEEKCNFPHCVGALDGKHISILPPPNSGSQYFNYKHFFSIVLLALVDANYRFLYVDTGCYGRMSDGGVYNNSSLAEALAVNSLNIPKPELINASDIKMPFVVVSDDAFPLKPYLMKPYSHRQLTKEKQIFNYRLSRARRVVEQAFGIMSQRFRVLGRPMPLAPEKAKLVVKTTCCLHNFLLRDRQAAEIYMTHNPVVCESETGTDMASMSQQGGNRYAADAGATRDKFCEYFNSAEGAVSWQDSKIAQL